MSSAISMSSVACKHTRKHNEKTEIGLTDELARFAISKISEPVVVFALERYTSSTSRKVFSTV
jgi:hypothetical protein